MEMEREGDRSAEGRRGQDTAGGAGPRVREALDAIEQLLKGLERVNLLMDACDAWLRDAEDPTRYHLGPRASEIEVLYEVEMPAKDGARARTEKRRRKLSELLALMKTLEEGDGSVVCTEVKETRYADPRDLVLKTSVEARQIVSLAVDLSRSLADVRAMEALRDAMLAEWERMAPEAAERIAEAVRRVAIVHRNAANSA